MLVQKVIEFAFLMHESCLYSEYSKLLLLLNPINCFYFTFIAEYSFQKFHSKSKVSELDLSISNFMKSYHLLSFFKFMHLSFKNIYSFVFIFVSLQLRFRYICFWDYFLKKYFKFVSSPIFHPNPIHLLSNSSSDY
jgi:hypothetical protein